MARALKIIVIGCFCLILGASSHAQSLMKSVSTNVLGYKFNTVTNVGDESAPIWEKVDDLRFAVNLAGGVSLELPLVNLSQHSSLGITLEATGGFLVSSGLDGVNLALVYDIPGYITFRYGAKANRKTDKTRGVGFGVGYHVSRGALPYEAPSVMFQVNFASGFLVRISYDVLPYKYYDHYSSQGLVPSLKIRRLGIGFYSPF